MTRRSAHSTVSAAPMLGAQLRSSTPQERSPSPRNRVLAVDGQAVDALGEREVLLREPARGVSAQCQPHLAVADVDVRVMLGALRGLGHTAHKGHRLLEVPELEGPLDRVPISGPAAQAQHPVGDLSLFELLRRGCGLHLPTPFARVAAHALPAPRCTRSGRAGQPCGILTSPKLCEPTWPAERPVPPVTDRETGASAQLNNASVPA